MKNTKNALLWIPNTLRGLATGISVGLFITVFANTIFFAGQMNQKLKYIFLFLPLAAVATSFMYKKLGENCKKTTAYAIDEIHSQEERKEKNLASAQNNGAINAKMGLVGFVASSLSHLFGASVGKEGVGVQIGISISALIDKLEDKISKCLKIKDSDSTAYYLMCGASAAFGALFGSPITGVLFGLQFASPDILRLDAILPCTFASFSAFIVSSSLKIHILQIPDYLELPFNINNIVLVIIFSLSAGFFVRFFCIAIEKCKALYANKAKPRIPYLVVILPSGFSALIILLNLKLNGNLLFNGLSTSLLYQAISSNVPFYSFLLKAILVLLSTLAGFVGGEVVPLLVLGATFGNTFATIFSLDSGAFAVLGALAMLSGGTNLPLVCFMLGIELFGYSEPLLLFIACAMSYTSSGKAGIYDHQSTLFR